MYFCTLESGREVEMKVVCHLSLTVVVKTPAEIDDHSRTSLTETAALKSKLKSALSNAADLATENAFFFKEKYMTFCKN